MDDAALVARIAKGDEQAMATLHARFAGVMHAVALRVTHADRLAEEVVQDALMAVWRNPGRYDPARGALGPWLLTLTRYKAIDVVRREAAIQKRTADVDLELREAPDDVHGAVWLGLRRARLVEAIGRLGPDQRRAVELAFVAGLTHVELAEREGIPLGTAKSRIRSGLLKLRHDLGSSLTEEPSPQSASPAAGSALSAPAAGLALSAPGPSSSAPARSPAASTAARSLAAGPRLTKSTLPDQSGRRP